MKLNLLRGLCLLFCMLFMQSLFAQNFRTVTGQVISLNDKLTLPGVSVILKGTSTGVQTGVNGNYRINVSGPNAVLVFTSKGFDIQKQTVGSQTTINVTMNPQRTDLNEVLFIGYGEVNRKDLTGAVVSVKMADIQKAPVRSFEEALAGRVAGVVTSADHSQPGSNINIEIRGNNSLTQDNLIRTGMMSEVII